MKKILILFGLTVCFSALFSQTIIEHPNFGTKTHPSLNINKIVLTENETIIYLTVENQIDGGWFCADQKLYILSSKEKLKLVKSEKIPVCPDRFNFTKIGERLDFTLYFPSIKKTEISIDIVEDCDNACFSFGGVFVSKQINDSINLAYKAYQTNTPVMALTIFKKLVENHPNYKYGIFIYNIIKIYSEQEEWNNAIIWYKKLLKSKYLDKQGLLESIRNEKFYSKISN